LLKYYDITQNEYVQALHEAGMSNDEIGTHAALADTSLELATAPDQVRADKLQQPGIFGAQNGVYGGNPARSTAALGQKGVDLIIAGTVTEIRKFVDGN